MTRSEEPFTPFQYTALIGFGAALWLAAALLLKYLAALDMHGDGATLALYGLTIPVTWGAIIAIKALVKLATNQLALACALMTGTATLLDGIALRWFPALYGSAIADTAFAGGAILWGAGVAIALGFVMNKAP